MNKYNLLCQYNLDMLFLDICIYIIYVHLYMCFLYVNIKKEYKFLKKIYK